MINAVVKKTKFSISLLLILSVFSVFSFGSLAHAQVGTTADPTVQTTDSPDPLDLIQALDEAGASCLTALLGSALAASLTNALASVLGSALTTKVPTGPVNIEVKETGIPLGPFTSPSLDGIAFCLANVTIELIIKSTTEWVKSGFKGNPAFIDDPEQFFLDLADSQFGAAINELSGGALCKPWEVEIILALKLDFTSNSFQSTCTLTEVIENAEDFIEGDFEEGGIAGWFQLTQSQHNNPYGALLKSKEKIDTSVANRQTLVSLEVGWAEGFLSVTDEDGNVVTPGTLIEKRLADRLGIPEDRLTFADEFDELISELVNALVGASLEFVTESF